MADTGWHNPAGMSNDASTGSGAWINVDNAKTSNDLDASATATTTYYLKATAFLMGVPAGATINGIYCRIEKAVRSGSIVTDYRVRIVKNSVIKNTDRAKAGNWTTTDTYYYYGSSSDKWGETWTVADINLVGFGMAISADISGDRARADIDHMQIKVYYTVPSTNIKVNIADVFKDSPEIKINIGDVWKNAIKIQQNIGDVWKTVFGA